MKQKGFTLIELVVVIVILGILAATALPRFVDFQADAADGAAKGAAGALASAASVNYARYQINASNATAVTNSTACSTVWGLVANSDSSIDVVSGNVTGCTGAGSFGSCSVKHSKGSASGTTASVMCTG